MTWPTLEISAAFDTDPYASPSWTDITNKAFRAQVVTGRQQALDEFQPGQAQIVLDNSARLFDPLYSAGTYFGKLLPNKRVRIRATYSGTTRDVFYGFADGWPQQYRPPNESQLTLKATDGAKFLARSIVVTDPYGVEVAGDSPDLWYRLAEVSGTTVIDSAAGHVNGTMASDAAFAQAEPITFSDRNSRQYNSATSIVSPFQFATGTGDWTIEFWMRSNRPAGDGSGIGLEVFVYDSPSTGGPIPRIRWDFFPGATALGDTWDIIIAADSPAILKQLNNQIGQAGFDGKPHHFVGRYDGTAHTTSLWIDGIDRTYLYTESTANNPDVTVGTLLLNNPQLFEDKGTADSSGTSWQEIALYMGANSLDDSQVISHHLVGSAPWDGDRTGARVTRILDAVGWPAADRNIDTGQTTLGPFKANNTTAAVRLASIANTEQGAVYIDHRDGGKLRFRDRATPLNATRSTTSQGTFSDDQSNSSAIPYSDIVLTYDEQLVINQVTVNWTGGKSLATDGTSVTTYGPQSRTWDTEIRTENEAQNLAQWLLAHYKDVFARIRSIVINPAGMNGTRADNAWAQVLDRKIGDRITIRRLPQGLGSAITLDVLIEGIEHDIDEGVNKWTTTFWCSPAEIQSYWILGTSDLNGADRLAY